MFGFGAGLCAEAGSGRSGIVAIDGTKLHANASRDANVDYDQIAREIIAEAIATDEAEDEQHGDARGDELPTELQTEEGRRAWLARELARDRARAADRERREPEPRRMSLMPSGSWRGCRAVRGGCVKPSASLTRIAGATRRPVPRSRSARLRDAARRLEDELDAERRGNEAYEDYRAHGRMKNGRRFGAPPKPYQPPASPPGEVNLTDPDSRVMKAFRGYVQGYNVAGGGQRATDRARRRDHRRSRSTSRT